MCSRFALTASPEAVAATFGLRVPPPWPERAEFRPTDLALALAPEGPALLRWGLTVEWEPRPMINARLEGLGERATFRPLLGHRLLIPASAWWEWTPTRTKMRLSLDDDGLMAFAALRRDDRFVIITRAAPLALQAVHARMPALAGPGWLADGSLDEAAARRVIARPDRPRLLQGDLFGPW